MRSSCKSKKYLFIGSVILLTVTLVSPLWADTYHRASFTGGIFSGTANVNPPFLGYGFQPGGPVSGSFVHDDQLIPAPGLGFVNVFFSSFPAIGNTPAATAFTINLGETPLTFTLAQATAGTGAIQYNNQGQFNGFFFQIDFL